MCCALIEVKSYFALAKEENLKIRDKLLAVKEKFSNMLRREM